MPLFCDRLNVVCVPSNPLNERLTRALRLTISSITEAYPSGPLIESLGSKVPLILERYKDAYQIEIKTYHSVWNHIYRYFDKNKFIGWPYHPNLGGSTFEDEAQVDRDKFYRSKVDVHPTDIGHQFIAEKFLNEIE